MEEEEEEVVVVVVVGNCGAICSSDMTNQSLFKL
jgi:hypothetical protein